MLRIDEFCVWSLIWPDTDLVKRTEMVVEPVAFGNEMDGVGKIVPDGKGCFPALR